MASSVLAKAVAFVGLVTGLSALAQQPRSTQPVAGPVLSRLADLVDPQYWATKSNESFKEFINELMPDLRVLADEAIAARWPAAGSLSEAGNALQGLARALTVWRAASAQMLLTNMEVMARSKKHSPLAQCLRELAAELTGDPTSRWKSCRASATLYRAMLDSPASMSSMNDLWPQIARTNGGARSSLSTIVYSIEKALDGVGSARVAAAVSRASPRDVAPAAEWVHRESINGVTFTPDERFLVSASSDRLVNVWDVETARLVRSFTLHQMAVGVLALSPDGRLVASAGQYRRSPMYVWELSTGRPLWQSDFDVSHVCFTPDGRLLLVVRHGTTTVALYDAATGRQTGSLEGRFALMRGAVDPTGHRAAATGWPGFVHIFDVPAQRLVNTVKLGISYARGLAFNRDGQILALSDLKGQLLLLDSQGAVVGQSQYPSEGASVLAFSPAENLLAVCGSSRVELLRVNERGGLNPEATVSVGDNSCRAVAFSTNGGLLAYATGRSLKLWDVRQRRHRR